MSEQRAFFEEAFKAKKGKIEKFLMKTNSKFAHIFQMKQNQLQEQQQQQLEKIQKRTSDLFKIKMFHDLKRQQNQNEFQQKPQFLQNEQKQEIIQKQNELQEVKEEQLSNRNQIQEPLFQRRSQTINICSACNQQQEQNHQCDGDFGFILCPYCGDNIVRNFMKEHQDECIPYLESQFQQLDSTTECSICSERISENKVVLQCGHFYHSVCINQWKQKKNECPICRKLF